MKCYFYANKSWSAISFGVFKYMALYSMIQFISVLILYTNRQAFVAKRLLQDLKILSMMLVQKWEWEFPR